MSKTAALTDIAMILLAERAAAEAARRYGEGKTALRGPVRYTESEVRHALTAAATLATCSATLDRVNENDCNGYRHPGDEARDEKRAKLAADKARSVAAAYGVGLTRGGDPRGAALKALTPHTARFNTMGGREDGWALSI